jgi:hypothetical protein
MAVIAGGIWKSLQLYVRLNKSSAFVGYRLRSVAFTQKKKAELIYLLLVIHLSIKKSEIGQHG